MIRLVTLAEAKALMRVDFPDDDTQIDLLIGASSDAVINYLKSQGRIDFYDETTKALKTGATVPENVKVATILLTAMIYEDPENTDFKNFHDGGYPPLPVQSILYQMRDPALA